MSVEIDPNGGLDFGGWVGETSSGTKCAVFYVGGAGIKAYKNIDSTPVQMGSSQSDATIHGSGGGCGEMDAEIDSNDVIHVVVGASTVSARDVAYNTLSDPDGTPTWGTWEEAAAYTNWDDTAIGNADITIDSNDDPHVAYVDDVRTMGARYEQIRYTEKTGASWATPQTVTTRSEERDLCPFVSVDSADDVHFLYKVVISSPYTNDSPVYRKYDTSLGSFETEDGHTVFADMADAGLALAVRGTTPWIVSGRIVGPSIYVGNDVDTLADTTFDCLSAGAYGYCLNHIGIYLTADDEYIIYNDGSTGGGTTGDIDIIEDTGSGWGNNQLLQDGDWITQIIGWQFNNLNNTTCIDYLFSDQSGIHWDEYCFAAAPRRVFVTHV
jgi:hypothetical protein